MLKKKILVQSLALAGLLAAAGAAQATITVYTSLASFTAAVLNPGTDRFDGFSLVAPTFGALNRTAGTFGYTARTLALDPDTNLTTETNAFFGAGSSADPWLSSNTATDLIEFGSFIGGVGALGGNFFGSNIAGAFSSGVIVVTATDADGAVSSTIAAATTDSFLGFVSSRGALSSVSVSSIQPLGAAFVWPTVDNLVLAAVPEPETYALLLAGLGIVGFMARRRRAD
jgi:hypothetical protein